VPKMFSWRSARYFVATGSLVLFGFASSAMADLVPYDPHALFATGGDATPIDGSTPITFSPTGGGIFVFENNTGADLAMLQVNVEVPDTLALSGFTVDGTIFVPPGQTNSSVKTTFILNSTCSGPSTTTFCEEITFRLIPGPLVLKGGNFVLDFDDPDPATGQYTGVDALVANGTYTGDGDTSANRAGGWGDGTTASVIPIPAVPEPRQYAVLLAAILALAIFSKTRQSLRS
jgi:hypothetical protein